MAVTKTEFVDLMWRCLWTFIQATLSGIVGLPILAATDMGGTVEVDLNAIQLVAASAVLGGIAAVASVVKTFASNKLGTGTATSKTKPSIGQAPVASISATPAQ